MPPKLVAEDMRRRRFTIMIGGMVGLAGCLNQPPASSQESNTKMNEGNIQRRVKISSQDSVPKDIQLQIKAEVIEPTITDMHTAQLRITTTNQGSKRALSIGTKYCTLFNKSGGGSDEPAGLWLYRTGSTDSINRKDDKWSPDIPPDKERGFSGGACDNTTYQSGETVVNDYEVWDDYRTEGYLSPGIYRWEEEVRIWENESAPPSDSPSATTKWGFSLSIQKPD